MNDTKRWWASSGVWGAISAILFAAAGAWGYAVTPDDGKEFTVHATSIAVGLSGLIALWGRVKARQKIG